MKLLALDHLLPSATEEKIYPHIKEEAAKAWELHKAGVFREMYFRTDRGGAVLILECTDVAEARKVLDTLPLVKAGLVDFDIIPLGPFMPLSTLFAKAG
jgi:muconolactone delta-isomerase